MQANDSNILDQLYEKLEEQKQRVAKIEEAIETLKKELNLRSSDEVNLFSLQLPASDATQLPQRGTGKASLSEMIPTIIRERGRFMHRSEIERILEGSGYEGSSGNISAHLSNLVKARMLYRIKFGESNNTFHYGLPEFVRIVDGKPDFASPRAIPRAALIGSVKIEEIIWNP